MLLPYAFWPNAADGKANRVDPDQTAPLGKSVDSDLHCSHRKLRIITIDLLIIFVYFYSKARLEMPSVREEEISQRQVLR